METPFPSLAWILAAPQHPGLKGAFGTVAFAPDQVLILSSLTQTLLTQEKKMLHHLTVLQTAPRSNPVFFQCLISGNCLPAIV